jgi:hypothetical protein
MPQQQEPKTQAPAILSERSLKTEDKFSGTVQHQEQEMAGIAVASKERALIESAFIMAKKFPRNEEDARAKILKTCSIYSFAEKAKYRKPIGNSFIEGPSIRLAEEMFRQWGHMRVDGTVLYDDPGRRMIQVSAMDMQSGATGTRQFTIEKTVERKSAAGRIVLAERMNSQGEKISIVVATEDEVLTKQNATLSKYRRNLIMELIPVDIVQDALAKVVETIRAGVKANPDKAKKEVMDNFAKLGILPSEIEKFIGRPLAQILPDDIVELKEVFTAITEGEEKWPAILAAKLGHGAPKDEPAKGSFKAGDASTHTAVDAKFDSERSKLLQEAEELKVQKGQKAFDAVVAKTGFKDIKDIPTGILKEVVTELNWN